MVSRSDPDWGTIRPDRCSTTVDCGGKIRLSPDNGPIKTSWKNALNVTVPRSIPSSEDVLDSVWHHDMVNVYLPAGDGIDESVSMWIPPAVSSSGSWKLLMVTPGMPLKAFNVTFLTKETLSKMVPRAVTRSLSVDITQVKLGLCNKNVANAVKLGESEVKLATRSSRTHPSSFVMDRCPFGR